MTFPFRLLLRLHLHFFIGLLVVDDGQVRQCCLGQWFFLNRLIFRFGRSVIPGDGQGLGWGFLVGAS